MRAWITGKSTARLRVVGATAVLLCGALYGEQPSALDKRASVGPTVSVVSLRIPEKAWRHFDKAKDLAEHNRFAESEFESGKAIAITPEFTAAYLLRASAQIQQHNFVPAIANIAEARRIEPDAMWAGVLLAGAFNGLQRYAEAEVALNALRGQAAQSWQSYYEHARAAIGLLNATAALHWSALTVEAVPTNFADVFLVRANALILAHRWDQAATQLEGYLQARNSQAHRLEVLAALQDVRRRARQEELQKVASR